MLVGRLEDIPNCLQIARREQETEQFAMMWTQRTRMATEILIQATSASLMSR
jgi:hypothetical protein